MRRDKINRIRKKKNKDKIRTVKVIFKNKPKQTKRKNSEKFKELRRLTRKDIVRKLKKHRIKTQRGSPTSILRYILSVKQTTGINIVRDF